MRRLWNHSVFFVVPSLHVKLFDAGAGPDSTYQRRSPNCSRPCSLGRLERWPPV